ncbi:MAG: lipoprotein [Hydrogenophaga sp.]|nr:lipoprotein [Hydrogenophaga sp.]
MLFGTQILGFHRHHARVVALALLAGLGLSGCGQKGPLYLPAPADQTAPKTSTTR